MSDYDDEIEPTLPGLELPSAKNEGGDLVTTAVTAQVAALRSLGYIEDHHAGQVALALAAARDIDRSFGRGAPSGRANLLRVMNEILESLPQPETASKDKLDQVLQVILSEEGADDEVRATT
jgi:hypothetical protein